MLEIVKFTIEPTTKKSNGAWTLDTDELKDHLPFDNPVNSGLVGVPPGEVAANHRHIREEVLVSLGNAAAEFIWLDSGDQVHTETLYPDRKLQGFIIPSNVPHAVINRSDHDLIMYEYFSDVLRGGEIQRVDVAGRLQTT